MHGDGGKGSGRRPMAISDQQYKDRWDLIFGRDKQDANVLAGNKDCEVAEQRVHKLDDKNGQPDGAR